MHGVTVNHRYVCWYNYYICVCKYICSSQVVRVYDTVAKEQISSITFDDDGLVDDDKMLIPIIMRIIIVFICTYMKEVCIKFLRCNLYSFM